MLNSATASSRWQNIQTCETEMDDACHLRLELQQKTDALENETAIRHDLERALRHTIFQRDEFLSMAGHELRTPLTALRLQLQILEKLANETNDPRVRAAAESSRAQEKKLTHLVDNLMDVRQLRLGRIQLDIKSVDLTQLVRARVEKLGPQMQLRSDGIVVGDWDEARLTTVIDGLLSNAMKFGGAGAIEIVVSADASDAYLIVKDHGIGILREDQDRIFNRFERACQTNNYSGLGLGLYVAKQIVDAHGGLISVDSHYGQGSTFVVRLPLQVPARGEGKP